MNKNNNLAQITFLPESIISDKDAKEIYKKSLAIEIMESIKIYFNM